ncbi:MAG TPA: response regulator [Bdellovibrionales bacterium]|nr:response regulator [Bdellovibrionales bacterium]
MRRVLVVDDNFDIRFLLRRALEMEGYAVEEAENGALAQRRLGEGARFDVILLDVMMPEMDGTQFLGWKNQQTHLQKVPVVMISALPPDFNRTGVHGYLRKPIDLNEMYAMLDSAVEGPVNGLG